MHYRMFTECKPHVKITGSQNVNQGSNSLEGRFVFDGVVKQPCGLPLPHEVFVTSVSLFKRDFKMNHTAADLALQGTEDLSYQ